MKVTFDDKVGITPRRIRINQVQDRDLNEIKNAINTNYDEFVEELVIKRVVYVTLSEIGITASSYTVGQLETAVTIYRNTLPDIVDNKKAIYDILLTENI